MNAHTFCPSFPLQETFWGYLHWEPFAVFARREILNFLPSDCYIIHFVLRGNLKIASASLEAGEVWVQSPVTALNLADYEEESSIFSVFLRPICYQPQLFRSQQALKKFQNCCNKLRSESFENSGYSGTLTAGQKECLFNLAQILRTAKTQPQWLEQVTQAPQDEELTEGQWKDLPLCERHFRRKFKQIMGLAPSVFFRLQRFHHALRLRKEKPYLDLFDLISLCKFYDHSHFTREFKHFSGLSPTKFFQHDMSYREMMIPTLVFGGKLELN